MMFGCLLHDLAALPFRVVDRIGRRVGLLDGDDPVRLELERLASAQAQMNEIVGALIEGLGELTRLQTASLVTDDSSRLERIVAAQEHMNELLELALDAGLADTERTPLS